MVGYTFDLIHGVMVPSTSSNILCTVREWMHNDIVVVVASGYRCATHACWMDTSQRISLHGKSGMRNDGSLH